MLKKNLIILLLLPVVILAGEYSVVTESSPWGIVAPWQVSEWDPYEYRKNYMPRIDSSLSCSLSWIRPNCSPFANFLQKKNGSFDFQEIDSLVKFMQEEGMNMLYFGWPPNHCYGVDSLEGYYWYFRILVERYDGDGEGIFDSVWDNGYVEEPEWLKKPIKYWNISNEPYSIHPWPESWNRSWGWPNYGNRTIEDFRSYVRAASKGIHDADPEAKVVGPSIQPLQCYWKTEQSLENDWRPISVTVKPEELDTIRDVTENIRIQLRIIDGSGCTGSVWIDNVWCQSNNIENYGFETGDLSEWEEEPVGGDAPWEVSAKFSKEGTYSLHFPDVYYNDERIVQRFPLSEIDVPFIASCWVKTENLTGGFSIEVAFWDTDSTEYNCPVCSPLITGTNPWTKIYVIVKPINIPPGQAKFKVALRRYEGSGKLWVDDVWCQSNVIENYSFEDSLNGWSLWGSVEPSHATLWETKSNYYKERSNSLYHGEVFASDSNYAEYCYQTIPVSQFQDMSKPFKAFCYVKDSALFRGVILEVHAEGTISDFNYGKKTTSVINSYSLSPYFLWWELFRDGIDTCIDIISIHKYWGDRYFGLNSVESSLRELDSMKIILDNLGLGDKPIWETEGGIKKRNPDTERGTMYREWAEGILERKWFKKMFFFSLKWDVYAILNPNWSHRPPYDTLEYFIGKNMPNINLVSPSEGETMFGGQSYEITYNDVYDEANVDPSSDISIRLEYSIDGGWNYTVIDSNLSPTGSYNWTPPCVSSDSCKFRVIARDSDGLEGMSTNSGFITINSGLQNETVEIGETRNYWSPDSIIAAGNSTFFVIVGNGLTGGNVTMRAGNYISLRSLFKAEKGCEFRAYIDPSLRPSTSSFPAKKISLKGEFKLPGEENNTIKQSTKKLSKETKEDIPNVFSCAQNYPNPFAQNTTIKYGLPKDVKVSLDIYNLIGQKVRTLVNAKQTAGYKSIKWDGRTSAGTPAPKGIYFYTFKAGGYIKHHKMILIK